MTIDVDAVVAAQRELTAARRAFEEADTSKLTAAQARALDAALRRRIEAAQSGLTQARAALRKASAA